MPSVRRPTAIASQQLGRPSGTSHVTTHPGDDLNNRADSGAPTHSRNLGGATAPKTTCPHGQYPPHDKLSSGTGTRLIRRISMGDCRWLPSQLRRQTALLVTRSPVVGRPREPASVVAENQGKFEVVQVTGPGQAGETPHPEAESMVPTKGSRAQHSRLSIGM